MEKIKMIGTALDATVYLLKNFEACIDSKDERERAQAERAQESLQWLLRVLNSASLDECLKYVGSE